MQKFLFLCVLFVAMCSISCSAQTKVANGKEMLFPNNGVFGLVIHSPYNEIKDLGVQWVRIGARWNVAEGKEKGVYDFADMDKEVKYYLDQKIRVMFIIGLEDLPKAYEADKGNQDYIIERIGVFAAECAKHYKNKNFLWEISNEPEVFPMGGYWNNPVTYTKMCRVVAKQIKKYDPKSIVSAGSVAWMDRPFLTTCMQNGILADGTMDAITYHGYHRTNYLPESGLEEDVTWLRNLVKKYSPKNKYVGVLDSERGFGILDGDPFQPRHADNWRNYVTCKSAQAAYLARHYFETIYLGVELAVWYKDYHGETSYSLYPHTREVGLSPMGFVYKNMANLFSENAVKLKNNKYTYALSGDNSKKLLTRSYLSQKIFNKKGDKLFITFWNPVEAFDGKILDKREVVNKMVVETWRDAKPGDIIDVTADVTINNLSKVKAVYTYDLLADSMDKGYKKADYEIKNGKLIVKSVKANAMPALIVVDLN